MPRPPSNRVALSLNVTPEALQALRERADREGHRYPSVLAAALLERAVLTPSALAAGVDQGGVERALVGLRQAKDMIIQIMGKDRAKEVLLEMVPAGALLLELRGGLGAGGAGGEHGNR